MKRMIFWFVWLLVLVSVCSVEADEKRNHNKPKQVRLGLTRLKLPEPVLEGEHSFEQILACRRSVRKFTRDKLDLEQVGQLAWAGQGITDKNKGFRTAPSAGAIYPIQLYFVVDGGMYLYHPTEHILKKVLAGNILDKLAVAALNQRAVAKAACDIIIVGSPKKTIAKYGNKARRYMFLEAGHVAQNIQLQAVSLGLGSVTIGAFDEADVAKLCGFDKDQEPIYIICVGYPADGSPIKPAKKTGQAPPITRAQGKKVVFIIPPRGFQHEELFNTLDVLTAAGVTSVVASSDLGIIKDTRRVGQVEATLLIDDIIIDDYDGMIFVSGSGVKKYIKDTSVLDIIHQAVAAGKVVAAIGTAPGVLAEAGVLDGIKVTSNRTERRELKGAGAEYTGNYVERDGLIVTGRFPRAASEFGKAVVAALANVPKTQQDETTRRHRKRKSEKDRH